MDIGIEDFILCSDIERVPPVIHNKQQFYFVLHRYQSTSCDDYDDDQFLLRWDTYCYQLHTRYLSTYWLRDTIEYYLSGKMSRYTEPFFYFIR